MEDLPPPSAELEIALACLKAHCAVLQPKQRLYFLLSMSDVFDEYEADRGPCPPGSRERQAAVRTARRQAHAWFKSMLPTFLGSG